MDESELRSRLVIDRLDLDKELSEQPSLFAYIAEIFALHEKKLEISKCLMREKEAEVTMRIRAQLEDEGKKPTEKTLEMMVRLDPEYQRTVRLMLTCQDDTSRIKALRDAFYQRKDSIIQLAINRRNEMQNLRDSIGVGGGYGSTSDGHSPL